VRSEKAFLPVDQTGMRARTVFHGPLHRCAVPPPHLPQAGPTGLEASASPTEEKKQNYNKQYKAESTTAVIADARPHVVSTAAENDQKNHENQD
jgi:hypothetical protein